MTSSNGRSRYLVAFMNPVKITRNSSLHISYSLKQLYSVGNADVRTARSA